MCRAAAEILKDAPGVIIDHVITSQRIFEQLLDLLGNFQIRTVHVSCPLEVLLQQMADRKLAVFANDRWHLTPEGMLVSNSLITDLLLAQDRSEPLAKRRM